jgi:predicted CXXCH cytochrome family protein
MFTKNESGICLECHKSTKKKMDSMERAFKNAKCSPIKERRCFECHIPMHSDRPLNHRDDGIGICARCHAVQHKITHPLGNGVIDPRDGTVLTCLSCHSMHSANGEFLLTNDKNRALCIQCHKM